MIKKTIAKTRVVTADTVELYNDLLDKATDELADYNPHIEFHQTNPMFAYIRYTIERYEAETIADEYTLKGIKFTCGDCPMLQGGDDRRRRYCWCEYQTGQTLNTAACDEFYKMLARGELNKGELYGNKKDD